MSTHSVNIIELERIEPHPDADRLDIVKVGGWQCVSARGNFKPGARAIYIEPDYMVPTDRPEFEFLKKDGRTQHRLKAVRLRGQISFGLLIPVPDNMKHLPTGSDVMLALGIERYAGQQVGSGAIQKSNALPQDEWPSLYVPKFDIESLQRYPDVIKEGEPVVITEKIHGANAKYVFHDGQFYVGSRTRWLKHDDDTIWHQVTNSQGGIRKLCENLPGVVVYGEVYGRVQSLRYGLNDDVAFAAFGLLRNGIWLDWNDVEFKCNVHGVPTAPVLFTGKYSADLLEIAERDSVVPSAPNGHMMEGIVITPLEERRDGGIGRVIVKHISKRYWLDGKA